MRGSMLSLLAVFLLAGCGAGREPAADPPSSLPVDAVSGRGPDGAETTGAQPAGRDVFGPWADRLDELLTSEMAAEAIGRPAALAQKRYRAGGNLLYAWNGERTMAYAGARVPVKDTVNLSVPRSTVTPAFFRSRFAALTEAQRKRLDEEVERQLAKSDLPESSRSVARGLAGATSERPPVEDVPGVGDDAVWETRTGGGGALHVLVGGSAFELEVSSSDDPAVDRAAAIALARQVIGRL